MPQWRETDKLSLSMKREDALRALRQGDYKTAASLLETVVREDRFSSDVLNNAYTIALYSAGNTGKLAGIEEVSVYTEDDYVELAQG